MSHGKRPRRAVKTPSWTMPTILGLILSVLGLVGLVELRPQLSVTPQEQLDRKHPFSAPFRITNTGYLSIDIPKIYFYVDELEDEHANRMTRSTMNVPTWNGTTLERGESQTIIGPIYESPFLIKKVEIAIVVNHRGWGMPYWTFRRYFRFQGIQSGDNWQWAPQPTDAPFIKRADESMDGATKSDGAK